MGRPKGSKNKVTATVTSTVEAVTPVKEYYASFKSPILECQFCKDHIWSPDEGVMVYCKCERTMVDATKVYVRSGVSGRFTKCFATVSGLVGTF